MLCLRNAGHRGSRPCLPHWRQSTRRDRGLRQPAGRGGPVAPRSGTVRGPGENEPRRCTGWGHPNLRHKNRGTSRTRAAGGTTLREAFTEGSGALCTARGADAVPRSRAPPVMHPHGGKAPPVSPRHGADRPRGKLLPPSGAERTPPISTPTIPFSGHPLSPQTPAKTTGGEGTPAAQATAAHPRVSALALRAGCGEPPP